MSLACVDLIGGQRSCSATRQSSPVQASTIAGPLSLRRERVAAQRIQRGWYIYGERTVSANGKQIIPDPGVRVWQFTGAMISGSLEPPSSKPVPCGSSGADPVDLGTGLWVYQKTDLSLPGALPVTLTRVYRPADSNSYSVGVGTASNYDMRLWSQDNYQTAELILPDGADIHYVRTSPGTGWTDAVYQAQDTCTGYYGSTITWNGTGWNPTLRTGLTYVFAEEAELELSAIRDQYGNQITIARSSQRCAPARFLALNRALTLSTQALGRPDDGQFAPRQPAMTPRRTPATSQYPSRQSFGYEGAPRRRHDDKAFVAEHH